VPPPMPMSISAQLEAALAEAPRATTLRFPEAATNQRTIPKDEVVIDVHDGALGHTTKQRWNDADQWICSVQIVHPPIIDDATVAQAQDILTARRGTYVPHKPHRSKHAYVVKVLLFCGMCERRMQGHWANQAPTTAAGYPPSTPSPTTSSTPSTSPSADRVRRMAPR
jgi:hypothetical protein